MSADAAPTSGGHRFWRAAASAAARGLARHRLRQATRVGRDAWVRGKPFVQNLGELVIGDGLRLHSYPTPSHIVTGPKGRVTIGNGVAIGPGAAIAAELEVAIGDGVVLGPDVMILDTDFHAVDDHGAASAPARVVIEAGAFLGRGVIVLKGARIGARAVVGAGGVVQGAVPGGERAYGVPARVHERPREGETGGGSRSERVAAVVAATFGLAPPIPATLAPADVPGWDSLGALRLLLALEEEFGVVLPEQALDGVHSVLELERAVAQRLG